MSGGRLVLQLHHWSAHEHPHLGDPDIQPYGNGVVLWFHDDEVDTAYKRAVAEGAEVIEHIKVNPLANHREFWLRDPNGYIIAVAGRFGDRAPILPECRG